MNDVRRPCDGIQSADQWKLQSLGNAVHQASLIVGNLEAALRTGSDTTLMGEDLKRLSSDPIISRIIVEVVRRSRVEITDYPSFGIKVNPNIPLESLLPEPAYQSEHLDRFLGQYPLIRNNVTKNTPAERRYLECLTLLKAHSGYTRTALRDTLTALGRTPATNRELLTIGQEHHDQLGDLFLATTEPLDTESYSGSTNAPSLCIKGSHAGAVYESERYPDGTLLVVHATPEEMVKDMGERRANEILARRGKPKISVHVTPHSK